eukprot:9431133-Pyramimonas_sp.AAC.1
MFRSSAATTETRRQSCRSCKVCGERYPSVRHLVRECPKFRAARANVEIISASAVLVFSPSSDVQQRLGDVCPIGVQC